MVLSCDAIASDVALELPKMLLACSSWVTAAYAIPAMYLQFVSGISFGCLIRTFEAVLAGCAAAVLRIYFVVSDEPFKVQFGLVKIVLDCDGLVFPLCHFLSKLLDAYICSR
jgi:hypothetical protein